MAIASSAASINAKKCSVVCPNVGQSVYTLSARLKPAQVRKALEKIDIAPGTRLKRYANYRAYIADIDADDLLQEAILRAMTTRNCPTHVAIEHFLMGVMRSIASKIIEKRERAHDALLHYSATCDNVSIGPDEAMAFHERAEFWKSSIEKVIAGSAAAGMVLDGIDQGLCGKALADFAEISQIELATVRRRIKRRVAEIWAASVAGLEVSKYQ